MPDAADASADSDLLLLVDGSSYLYRAFHALPDLRSARGRADRRDPRHRRHDASGCASSPVGPCGVRVRRQGQDLPRRLVRRVQGQPRRHARDLARQIEPIHEAVQLLGWPVLEVPGIEADDAIGTLAACAARRAQVVISTGDKDLAQLVDAAGHADQHDEQRGLDVDGVMAKFGVPPGAHRRLPDADRRQRSTTCRASTRSARRPPRSGSPSTARSTA
jgi:DNA polymerase-1